MTDRLTLPEAEERAYERGYRSGRIQARAEMIALYSERIRDAGAILNAPLPAADHTPPKEAA